VAFADAAATPSSTALPTSITSVTPIILTTSTPIALTTSNASIATSSISTSSTTSTSIAHRSNWFRSCGKQRHHIVHLVRRRHRSFSSAHSRSRIRLSIHRTTVIAAIQTPSLRTRKTRFRRLIIEMWSLWQRSYPTYPGCSSIRRGSSRCSTSTSTLLPSALCFCFCFVVAPFLLPFSYLLIVYIRCIATLESRITDSMHVDKCPVARVLRVEDFAAGFK